MNKKIFGCTYGKYKYDIEASDMEEANDLLITMLVQDGIEPDMDTEILIIDKTTMGSKEELPKVEFTPLNDFVLFMLPEVNEKTEAGVIKSKKMIEDEKKGKDAFVTVLAVGENVGNIDRGDKVLVEGQALKIPIDGKEYGLCREHYILGKKATSDEWDLI